MDSQDTRRLAPFLKRVRRAFKPARILLFGSRARGDSRQDSDYDLLIISPAFARVPFYFRHVQVFHLLREPLSVDVICLTPEEFKKRSKELSIIGVAAREGVELAA